MPSIMTAWTPRLGKLGYLGCVEMRYIQGVLPTDRNIQVPLFCYKKLVLHPELHPELCKLWSIFL